MKAKPPSPSAASTAAADPLSDTTTAQIQALPLEQLEALADFQGPSDLAAWLTANSNNPA